MKLQRTHAPEPGMPPLNVSQGIILYVNDVTVSFDGFKALN